MKILGIDPGYDRVGWAILTVAPNGKHDLIEYGCIQTNKKAGLLDRYSRIVTELQSIYAKHEPEEVSMESVFFSKNQKTAMRVSEARGVIIASFLPYCSSLIEYTPNQVKLAVTGYGSADKAAVEKMIRMQLHLQDIKVIDDTIDAIAIAFTHSLMRGRTV